MKNDRNLTGKKNQARRHDRKGREEKKEKSERK